MALAVRGAYREVLRLKLALVDRRKTQRTRLEYVDGLPILVLPNVFNPKLLRSGEFLVQQLHKPELLPPGSKVLDLGCGSGVAAIAAARRGCAVVAVDINSSALRCTRVNALLNDVAIDVRHGDLFGPVAGEQFDVVLFNPPYYRGSPRDDLDYAWRSPDIIERFATQLGDHLAGGGHALLVLSSDGEHAGFVDALRQSGCESAVVAQRDFINEIMQVHQVRAC